MLTLHRLVQWPMQRAGCKQRAAASGGCLAHAIGTPTVACAGRSNSSSSNSSMPTRVQPAVALAAALMTAGGVLEIAAMPATLTQAGQCRMMTHICSGGCCGGCLASCRLRHRPCTPSTLECAHTVLIAGEMHEQGGFLILQDCQQHHVFSVTSHGRKLEAALSLCLTVLLVLRCAVQCCAVLLQAYRAELCFIMLCGLAPAFHALPHVTGIG